MEIQVTKKGGQRRQVIPSLVVTVVVYLFVCLFVLTARLFWNSTLQHVMARYDLLV